MLLSIPFPPSCHSLHYSKAPLTHSLPLCSLPFSVIRHKSPKHYARHFCCSSREAAGKSAIQRISEKLRSLGYLPYEAAVAAAPPPTGPGSAGEIFIPTPYEIPKHRVGYTFDPSWSTPENPVPVPGSGDTITRFRELWKSEQDSSQPSRKEMNFPSVAELTLPGNELKRLRTLGITLRKRLKVGKSGITEGIVNGIHERWLRSEVVKIRCEDLCGMNMKRTHEILERKTGGLVVWRSGNIVVLYRGTNYKYPYFHTKKDISIAANTSITKSTLALDTSVSSDDITVHTPFVSGEDKMENLNEDYSKHSMDGIADKNLSIASNTSIQSSGSRVCLSFVNGVGSPTKLRMQLPGETRLKEEADRLLDGLGPRFIDWWGEDPLPVDGDLLPSIVPGYRKSFRLLPFGLKPQLTDREATILRRLSRHIPCHFALGRNRKHQGLAVSIIKLWEKCEIAKIAIKRGAQNTNSEIMAEELKKLTGGILLSRDKYFFVLYRGKDFLPPAVSVAIEERRNLNSCHRKPSEDDVSPFIENFSSREGSPYFASDKEFKKADEKKRPIMAARDVKSTNSPLEKVDAKIIQANQKIEKTKKHLDELEEMIEAVTIESDKEGISEEERYMLRKVGLRMKPFLLLGRRGVFDGTIENMHLHWKYRELVKIIFNDRNFENVENTARTLEAESGGILVAIERVSKGYAVVIYRGKNYRRPTNLRPETLLNKKEALKRSIEAQRYESLKLHALSLSKPIDQLDDKAHSGLVTNMFPFTEVEGPNSSNETSAEIETFKFEYGDVSEPKIEINKSVQSEFDGGNFEKMIVLEHQQERHETEIAYHSLLFSKSISLTSETESIDDDETLLSHSILQDQVSNPVLSGNSCTSKDLCVNFSIGRAQSFSGPSSMESNWEPESVIESRFRRAPLSNRERLLLRKQALKKGKRPVLAVGRSNIITGVTKTIMTHFKKHPLAIVNIKGRAKGTSVQELVFELEQATGSFLVSREPNKIILYRGWGEGDLSGEMQKNDLSKAPMPANLAQVSHQLIEAIRQECGLPSPEAE